MFVPLQKFNDMKKIILIIGLVIMALCILFGSIFYAHYQNSREADKAHERLKDFKNVQNKTSKSCQFLYFNNFVIQKV